MRVVICGDSHVGVIQGLGYNIHGSNTRVDDYEKTLNYIVDYTISTKADIFIQTGDVFEVRNPSPDHMNIINQAIKKLAFANIISVVLMGNHDYKRTGETFTSSLSSLAAKDYSNVRVILEPEIIKLEQAEQTVNLLLLPYRDRRMYSGKTIQEASEQYEAEVSSLIQTVKNPHPIVAVGHNFFYEGNYTDFGGHEILTRIDTFKRCDLVAMGHLHQFRIVRKKDPIAIYTGSMEKQNFGDEQVDKYFLDYNIDTKKTTILKTPVRQLQDLKIELPDAGPTDLIERLQAKLQEQDLKDKIVRLKVVVKDTLLPMVKKNELEKQLLACQAFYVSKITVEPIINRLVQNEKILEHKDDLSMFKAYVESQEFDAQFQQELLSEAQNIIK